MCPAKNVIFTALSGLDDLPTIPSIMQQIERALNDEGSTVETIAQIISEDPPLTMKVLKVANSAIYAIRGARISSVKLAVSRLGLSEVKRLCQILSLIKKFQHFGSSIDHRGFWKHSLLTGMTARYLCQLLKPKNTDEDDVYVGGLLHDIGFLILDQYFPALLRDIGHLILHQNMPCHEAEYQIIESSHGEIGAFIMQQWNLSPGVNQIVSYHHNGHLCEPAYRNMTGIVRLADTLCTRRGVGGVFNHEINEESDRFLAGLNLQKKYPEIENYIDDLIKNSDAFLEI